MIGSGRLFLQQALRLVRREMRNGLHGFGVFLACLFLGVFTISAIGHFSVAARSGLLNDAGSLLGGDLEVRLEQRPLSEPERDFLTQRGEISEVLEMRTMVSGPDVTQRLLVELKAVDTVYPLYGELRLQPAARDTVLPRPAFVDPRLLERLNLEIGDSLEIGRATFAIAARIDSEPDRSARIFSLGPRVLIAQNDLPATELVRPGSLVTYRYRLRIRDRSGIDELKQLLKQRFPDAGWRIRDWRRAAPRVHYFLDRLETNLTLLGLCSLLVGGLGVSGAVRGYLRGKTEQIATLKCLGATRRMIFVSYLLQLLALGGLGSGCGLLAGAGVPWLLNLLAGEHLPLPLDPSWSPQVLVMSALFGLLIAVLFSLHELDRACRVPPAVLFRGYNGSEDPSGRSTMPLWLLLNLLLLIGLTLAASPDRGLAAAFMIGAALCFLLFRVLSGVSLHLAALLPRPAQPSLRLALAGLQRPDSPARSIIFALGIGLTALVMIVQIQGSLNARLSETLPRQAPAFFFFDIQPEQIPALETLLEDFPEDTRLTYSPTLRGRITAISGVPVEQAQIDPDVRWAVRGDRFLSYAAHPPASAEIIAGRWWPADYQGPPQLSLTADLAEGFGVGIGDTLSVNVLGRTVTAEIANLRRVDWSTLELNFALIFAPGILEGAPQTSLAAAHLQAALEERLYRRVTETFPNVSAVSVRDVLDNVMTTLQRIGWVFKGIAAIALLTGFLVLAGAVSADQHRRLREAVIFKVCGGTRRDILLALAAEFCLLGLVSVILSLVVGTLAALAVLKGPLDTAYSLQPLLLSGTLLSGLLLTLLTGLLGTWRALGQKVGDFLRRDL